MRYWTGDTWHVTCDTWHMTGGGRWTFSQNFSSLELLQFGNEVMNMMKICSQIMTEWINYLFTQLIVKQPQLIGVCWTQKLYYCGWYFPYNAMTCSLCKNRGFYGPHHAPDKNIWQFLFTLYIHNCSQYIFLVFDNLVSRITYCFVLKSTSKMMYLPPYIFYLSIYCHI